MIRKHLLFHLLAEEMQGGADREDIFYNLINSIRAFQ